jgi:hypothetical protein
VNQPKLSDAEFFKLAEECRLPFDVRCPPRSVIEATIKGKPPDFNCDTPAKRRRLIEWTWAHLHREDLDRERDRVPTEEELATWPEHEIVMMDAMGEDAYNAWVEQCVEEDCLPDRVMLEVRAFIEADKKIKYPKGDKEAKAKALEARKAEKARARAAFLQLAGNNPALLRLVAEELTRGAGRQKGESRSGDLTLHLLLASVAHDRKRIRQLWKDKLGRQQHDSHNLKDVGPSADEVAAMRSNLSAEHKEELQKYL